MPAPQRPPLRVAYLGPSGTFTEQAVLHAVPRGADLRPYLSGPQALQALRAGEADRAVVPMENSVEGGVHATLDALSQGSPLRIVAEMVEPVSFTLAVRPGAPEAAGPARASSSPGVTRIGTHPHAWAQCRRWVEATYPQALHIPTTSTAEAAALLARGEGELDAVLCSPLCVTRYGLRALHRDVADNPGAVTRFIMAARPGPLPAPTGADKTTIQVRLPSDEPGSLLTMLQQLAVRGVNLSRIESRPSGDGLGSYSFSMDLDGHVRDERVRAALVGLHRTCPEVKFMGSYPRADRRPTRVRPGTSDADFRGGRAWVRQILEDGDPAPASGPDAGAGSV